MALDSTHPDYDKMANDYRQMRDTSSGQRAVKQGGTLYLKPTAGMTLDGAKIGIEPGYSAYLTYMDRAIYPNQVDEAVRTMVGILNREKPEISVPARMEEVLFNATRKNESIWQLIRRIHEAQLIYGRIGLLIDVEEGASLPHIVTYNAESVINWDDQRVAETGRDELDFVITSEDAWVRGAEATSQYEWTVQERFRVSYLNEGGAYATFTEQDDVQSPEIVPTFGGKSLNFVPFTFVGANDLISTPGTIPLLGLSNSALAIYRGEADFRQTLHMLGQDTLVLIGTSPGSDQEEEDTPTRIGTSAKILVPEGGDAKFIGISSEGLPEQRRALEEDYARAIAMGSRLLENTSSQAESGEALRVRVAAKTTTLHSVALTCAAGVEQALKQIALWVGANPDEVIVTPNTDFVEDAANPEQALKLIEARNVGFPISLPSIHEWAAKNEFTQKTWEQELEMMQEDAKIIDIINSGAPQEPAEPVAPEGNGSGGEEPEEDEEDPQSDTEEA